MKKLVMVVLALVMVGLSNAAMVSDDFTSNTMSNYTQTKYFDWAPWGAPGSGIENTATWDGSSNVLVSSDNAFEGSAMLNKTQRAAGSSVTLSLGALWGKDNYHLNGTFGNAHPIGLIISDRIFDSAAIAGGFATFKGYLMAYNGNMSYFTLSRLNADWPTQVGNPMNPTRSDLVPWFDQKLTMTPTANGFQFSFDSSYLHDPTYGNYGGPQTLWTDNSGILNDADLKYVGFIWGTWQDNRAQDELYEVGSYWHNAPIDKLEYTAVPEPATLALLSLGLLTVVRRRKSA